MPQMIRPNMICEMVKLLDASLTPGDKAFHILRLVEMPTHGAKFRSNVQNLGPGMGAFQMLPKVFGEHGRDGTCLNQTLPSFALLVHPINVVAQFPPGVEAFLAELAFRGRAQEAQSWVCGRFMRTTDMPVQVGLPRIGFYLVIRSSWSCKGVLHTSANPIFLGMVTNIVLFHKRLGAVTPTQLWSALVKKKPTQDWPAENSACRRSTGSTARPFYWMSRWSWMQG